MEYENIMAIDLLCYFGLVLVGLLASQFFFGKIYFTDMAIKEAPLWFIGAIVTPILGKRLYKYLDTLADK